MKAYDELQKLTKNLMNAEDEESRAEAKADLEEFMDYKNYWKRRPDIEDAVKTLSDAVNIMGGNKTEEFVKLMSTEHRTLQQGMTKLFIAWLQHLAELQENWYDLRNEASVKFSRDMISFLKFTFEMNRYHTSEEREKKSQIRYMEEHKLQLEEFIAFVRGFVLEDIDLAGGMPTV